LENPLKIILEKNNLTPRMLSIATQTPVSYIYNTLSGLNPIPGRILEFFKNIGIDTAYLIKEFEEYRHHQQQKIIKEITQKGKNK
jgi:hypothetical protein